MHKPITLSTCAFPVSPSDRDGVAKHFDMAMEAGFDGFELAMVPMESSGILRDAALACGAKVVAIHGMLDGDSCSPDPAKRAASAEKAWRYLEEFAEFAPSPIVEHYHNRFNDLSRGEYFRDAVAQLLEKTEAAGYTFCMENAPYKPEYDERFPPVAEIADFVRSFGENRMFMTFDLNHANLHEDPVEVAAQNAQLVRHIHVSDNQGHREQHMLPGMGVIDFKAVLSALYNNGYDGPCNLEVVFPKGAVVDVNAYRQVYEYMKNIEISGE